MLICNIKTITQSMHVLKNRYYFSWKCQNTFKKLVILQNDNPKKNPPTSKPFFSLGMLWQKMPICCAPMQLLALVAPEGNWDAWVCPSRCWNLKHVIVEVLNGMEWLSIIYWVFSTGAGAGFAELRLEYSSTQSLCMYIFPERYW